MATGYRDELGRFVKGVKNISAGKPTRYNKEVVNEFVHRLKFQNIIEVCKDISMPCADTIYEWKSRYPDFKKLVEETQLQLVETRLNNAEIDVNAATPDNVQVAKLKFSVATWFAERLLNHRYGSTTKIVGGDSTDNPISYNLVIKEVGKD